MDTFTTFDGTRMACHRTGNGNPLIVVPGGPMQAAAYLGDLGGLTARHPTVLLDLRGTGESATPIDPATYRCDRQADDIEALRRHLGLDRFDLAAHSAGAAIALRYAAQHPDRVGRLLLITPSPYAAGIEVKAADRRAVAERRRGEPWFPAAFAALERLWAGEPVDPGEIAPFSYDCWDGVGRQLHAREREQRNAAAAAAYYGSSHGDDVLAVRAALARLTAPVLLVAGEFDPQLPPPRAAEYAGTFPNADLAVLPGAAHFPWLSDPIRFVQRAREFLAGR